VRPPVLGVEVLVRALLLAVLLIPLPATAQDVSLQLLRPSFQPHAWLGHSGATLPDGPAARVGAMVQGEREPVVAWFSDGTEQALVVDRVTAVVGGWFGPVDGFGVGLQLPLGLNVVGELEPSTPEAFVGDLRVEGQGRLLSTENASVAASFELHLPTGTRGSLSSEPLPRGGGGIAAELGLPQIGLLAAADIQLRTPQEFLHAPIAGPALGLLFGVRASPAPGVLDVLLEAEAVLPIPAEEGAPTAPSPAEARLGVRLQPRPDLRVDLGAGVGLGTAPSSPEFRVIVGLSATPRWAWRTRTVRPEPVADPVPDSAPEPTPEPSSDPPSPHPDPLPFNSPVLFDRGSAALLRSAWPALDEVATLLVRQPRITQLLLVGHASPDGDGEHNYALSLARADAVFRALIVLGVQPSRLSVRAGGETRGQDPGDARRVGFFVVRRLDAWEGDAPRWSAEPRPWKDLP
jgi:outer membrane protein OmpA-like peptidoglycan-associated protein